jgi:hypothetical protein
MPYARTDVRTALHAAREAGKPCDGLIAGDRETALQLERWGFLPVNQEATDKRIQDWYISQGLAIRESDTPERVSDTPRDTRGDTPEPTPGDAPGDTRWSVPTLDVLAAAESALETARVALSLARSMASGSDRERERERAAPERARQSSY